jgi:RND family efflux transporter MFP subunit
MKIPIRTQLPAKSIYTRVNNRRLTKESSEGTIITLTDQPVGTEERRIVCMRLFGKSPIAVGLALAGCLILTACQGQAAGGADPGEAGSPAAQETAKIPVAVQETAYQSMEKTVLFGGLLTPSDQVNIMGGGAGSKLESILIKVGDRVAKGQTVAVMDQRDLELTLANLEIQISQAQLNLERNRALEETGAVTRVQIEQMEDQIKQLEIQRENVALQQERMAVSAPISGIVDTVLASEGQLASAQTVVGTIVNIDILEFKVDVGENYIKGVKQGETLQVRIPSMNDMIVDARITSVPPNINPVTKAFTVTMEIDNAGNELKGGLYAETSLVVDRRDGVIAVPQYALLEVDQATIVYVAEDGVARRREVEVGLTLGDTAEIISGLSEGEQVVVEGQYSLADGVPVLVTARGEAS